MTTATATATALRQKFTATLDALTLDQALTGLVLVANPETEEEMMVRVGLINSIERRFPNIAAWIADFYSGEDDDPRWDIDYPDAMLLARDALGL